MKKSYRWLVLPVSTSIAVTSFSAHSTSDASRPEAERQSAYALSTLIEIAVERDSNRKQYFSQSQAMRETGVAQSSLMDPKLKFGVGGLPVDSFKLDEDPMTNLSVGLMQQFERGSTLALQQQRANHQATGIEIQAELRERDVINAMTQLWIELAYQQRAQQLLEQNRQLMVEMAQFVETNYAIGKSEAQDLLNAQLQVSKADDKLQANAQMQRRIVAQLSEWLGAQWLDLQAEGPKVLSASLDISWSTLDALLAQHSDADLYQRLNQHPAARVHDAMIRANETQVSVAEQAYTPQFGVEVMYAYRQAESMGGGPASDLVSAYVTMDIPLFTGNRQDRQLAAAQHQVGAVRAQKDALLEQMHAQVNALLVDRDNLAQRIERYQDTLLPQASARIEAIERGYQNNTAQFNDVIVATSEKLTLTIELERLSADLSRVNSQLATLLSGFDEPLAPRAETTRRTN